jgi:glutamate-ammonia-ligase adenylyltransferase
VSELGRRISDPLARLGFADVRRTGGLLADPALGLWDLDALELLGPGADEVVAALAAAADPDLALLALNRLAEAAPDRTALLDALRSSAGLRARLLGLLGASSALGDHLVAHPEDWTLLTDEAQPASRPSEHDLTARLLTAIGVRDAAGVGRLRVAYRRLLLVLAARDVAGTADVDEVAGELADLAAATLQAALALAAAALPAGAAECRLAVIGLGKCGGRELNYVSDVDVVFVAEPVGSGDDDAALRTATLLASSMMRICAEVAWPVDAALRPEGKNGPLVRTLASHESYYERWARTWEFQALVKARPVAGDLDLGRAYIAAIAPMVWSAAQAEDFVGDVQAMRRRVEDTLPGHLADRELKLGPGGLRDVEFAVQLLQLVHGRADETLRDGSTLVALEALAAGGYVGREDAATLAAAYRFLRVAEHRLQLHRLRRTHLLPDDPAGVRRLARAMGLAPDARGDVGAVFEAEHTRHAREVRRLHEKLFYRPLLTTVARMPTDQLRLTPEAARARLVALGFDDPEGALNHLAALTAGVSRRAAIQRTLLPALLGLLADAPDPDAGLLSYRQVSEALSATPWYLRLLRDEGPVADRLATVLGSSRYAAGLLARAPEALRLLGDAAELAPRDGAALRSAFVGVARRQPGPDSAVLAVRGMRRRELLRTSCADLLDLIDVVEVGDALSAIAAATLDAALTAALRAYAAEHGPPQTRIAIIAMGRLGGRELGYGSDADVMFVHEPVDGTDEQTAGAAATAIVEHAVRLLRRPAPDPPLEVDAGLRPEGRNGPLVRSFASYAAYYARWSAVWEAQALLRAAPVAGDPVLGQRFVDLIDPVRYPAGGLKAPEVTEIRRIKARVDAERLPRGADPATHTKLGPGGLADVEWTVQLWQLRHAAEHPELRTTRTLDALRAIATAGLLDADDVAALEASWLLATRARNAMMLVRGRADDQLPRRGRVLTGVTRVLGYPPGRDPGQFLEDYRRAARRARRVVERVFYADPIR